MEKQNLLFNVISHQLDIDKIYLYAKIYRKQRTNCQLTNKKIQV